MTASGSLNVGIPHPPRVLGGHSLRSSHSLPSFSHDSSIQSNFALHTPTVPNHYVSVPSQHHHANVGGDINANLRIGTILETVSESTGILKNAPSSRATTRTSTHSSFQSPRIASYQHPSRLTTRFSQHPQSRQVSQLATPYYNPANESFSGKPLSIIDDLRNIDGHTAGVPHRSNSGSSSRSHVSNNPRKIPRIPGAISHTSIHNSSTGLDTGINASINPNIDTSFNTTFNTSFNTSFNTTLNAFNSNAFNPSTFTTNKPLVIIRDN